ncbi:Helicase PriA essential for oriC/DnaA-independent DNA replication [Helicobacter heilmannii]|uniref:replication restart helicase PriA n=1 Tax=Helicobacter heilmannii TaxID=35817 RepID=UPI0006A118D8|nr:primosomal protein N' [Helicobacter heilmannii]CRF48903.1 Helicase PriA essential for oriC/DnaA-independent DNA replication [Helicobacter heilmannii]
MLKHYSVAVLKHKLKPLTYQSQHLLRVGDVVQVPLNGRACKGVVLSECATPNFECKDATPTEFYLNAPQMLLLEFIATYYCCPPSLAATLFTPFSKAKPTKFAFKAPNLSPLSGAQQAALNVLKPLKSALLFGDTGSGKTHIYSHLILEKLQNNQSVVVLVPEIGLTSQTKQLFLSLFGAQVGLWHSKLSPAQKKQTLAHIASGQIKIIVGTRSALFLPMPNLGLVLVDEEHDQAYKASLAPYYNARDCALYLASKLPIQVILGSATPNLRSYYRAKKNQSLVRLRGRYFASPQEIIFEESKTVLTPLLLEHLSQSLHAKEQSIIFLPTRASFKKLLCLACGGGVKCPFCSVNMSLHLKDKRMRCHYCQHEEPIPKVCPACKQDSLAGKRIGTQQLKSELEKLLPSARIGILDKDHTHTNKQIQTILDDFNAHQIDILIGTQMLAKGHDYHRVGLAVVLGLDEVLNNGSYRSYEEGVALMHQIAGRSGRKKKGRVLIQSLNAPFLERYTADFEEFLKEELQMRTPCFPPLRRLARIEFRDKELEAATAHMQAGLDLLKPLLEQHRSVEVLGAGQARVTKIAGQERLQILLSATSTKELHLVLRHLQEHAKGVFKIDIDPQDI